MTTPARIVASAVGFDLGETLYHYGGVPFSWIERGRPALDRALDACGVDRSKADIAAAHGGEDGYSSYLRGRIEGLSAADILTDVLARLGGRNATRVETAIDGCFGLLRRKPRGVPGRARDPRRPQGSGSCRGRPH